MQTHSPKKLYRSIVMEKIKLTDLGMDEIDAMMVQEALHKTFYDESISMIVSQKEKENVGLKSTSRDVDNNIEKKGSGSGSEIINETIESININSIVKIDEKVNYLSAFKQKKILRSEERENELESPDSQQSDISSPNTFDNLGDSLNQIMSQSFMQPPSDYDHFMAELSTVMLHPDRTRKSKSIFSSSHHSAGVSNVLAGLPSRPSSVITVKIKASSIPTDLLLSRVASVLKRNDSNGFRKQMR